MYHEVFDGSYLCDFDGGCNLWVGEDLMKTLGCFGLAQIVMLVIEFLSCPMCDGL